MRRPLTFHIPEMSCAHCSAAITRALYTLEPGALIAIDLPARTAQIESARPPQDLIAALDDAGFEAHLSV